jgi:glycosyltransferase involved in cell wall biosynthesis
MTKIAIVAPSLWSGDAVGNDILHMDHLLREQGHEVRLFADHVGATTRPCQPIERTSAFLGANKTAIMLYHHSINCVQAMDLIRKLRCRRVVRYHNVTPAHFYQDLNARYAEDCRKGREQLHSLAKAECDLYLSDSTFNQQDLLAAGANETHCFVVPPFHRIGSLCDTSPDAETVDACDDGRIKLLFVGRFTPNKGHMALIDAFAVYQKHYERNSRLLLIGKEDDRLSDYTVALRRRIKDNGLEGLVTIAPAPTEAVLKAYYEAASIFVIASEHEGFCVPLVEAMALGRPVVGYGSSAVLETLGRAGILWPDRSPWLCAESIHCVMNDEAVYAELQTRGRVRYSTYFSNSRTKERFFDALNQIN